MSERPDWISERNWAIYTARQDGETLASIGGRFAITRERVRQILAKTDRVLSGAGPTARQREPEETSYRRPDDNRRCRGTNRDGTPCGRYAVWDGLCGEHHRQERHTRTDDRIGSVIARSTPR